MDTVKHMKPHARMPVYVVLASLGIIAGSVAGAALAREQAQPGGAAEYLWTLTASRGHLYDANGHLRIVLEPVASYATAFTDRPERHAAEIPTSALVDQWQDLFATSAPNAVLTYVPDGHQAPLSVPVTLDAPTLDTATGALVADATVLAGAPDPGAGLIAPLSAHDLSLFIDPSGTLSADTAASVPAQSPSGPAFTTSQTPLGTNGIPGLPGASTAGAQQELTSLATSVSQLGQQLTQLGTQISSQAGAGQSPGAVLGASLEQAGGTLAGVALTLAADAQSTDVPQLSADLTQAQMAINAAQALIAQVQQVQRTEPTTPSISGAISSGIYQAGSTAGQLEGQLQQMTDLLP